MTQFQLIPVFVFFAVLLAATAGFLVISARWAERRGIHRRLNRADENALDTSQLELKRILSGRSLSDEGHYSLPLISLNRLIVQSGVTVGARGVLIAMAGVSIGCYFIMAILQDSLLAAILCGTMAGIGFPIFVLRSLRMARQRKFEEQLPEAIDIIVRGLKAGHAIPVAIATVGRQMPEPLGGEFGITGAELTYGLDLETAMVNLRSRVGQADLALLVLAVSIQAKMGGNLAEILGNLSKVIRDRFKLRRKARALSAEGRYSALFLSLLPFILFCVLWLISPAYYGEVWDEWYVKPALGGAIVWMLIGNYVMYRMVKFAV
jgi:tight adherence protein B